MRVTKKMIQDLFFLHSKDSNCGCDRNALTGASIMGFIFASQEGARCHAHMWHAVTPTAIYATRSEVI